MKIAKVLCGFLFGKKALPQRPEVRIGWHGTPIVAMCVEVRGRYHLIGMTRLRGFGDMYSVFLN